MGVDATAWIHNLHNGIVGIDTAPLIYYIEEHPWQNEHFILPRYL